MNKTWLIIANSAKVDIYSLDGKLKDPDFHLVKTFENPESRIKTHELVDDQAGQFGPGTGGHGNYSHNDAHQNVLETFAKSVAEYIDKEKSNGSYEELALVADPIFLGLLFGFLTSSTQELVKAKVAKNYVHSIENKELTLNDIYRAIHEELIKNQ